MWTLVLAGVGGLVLGCSLRTPALLIASAIAAGDAMGMGLANEWSLLEAAVRVLADVSIAQAGYLAGLMMGCAAPRAHSHFLALTRSRIAPQSAIWHS